MDRKIHADLVTEDYRGDHGADIRIALETDNNETVYQFMERIFDGTKEEKYRYQDHIELRIVKPIQEGERT